MTTFFLGILPLNYPAAFMLVRVNLFNITPYPHFPGIVGAGFKIS